MGRGVSVLLTRSLRVDARLLRTHLFRLGFVGFICLLLFYAQFTSMVFGAPGLQFFKAISYLNFVLITIAGIGFFATAITEEKEEGTLGLLKMAGISRVGILLGKSTSRLISVTLLLLVQLPFTLLAITLGGITLSQVLAAYLALLAYTAMVANLALLFSVCCRRSGSAAAGTGILVIAFLIIPPSFDPALNPAAGTASWAADACGRLTEANVAWRLSVIMTTGFAEPLLSLQVLSNIAAAFVFFVLSWITFDRFTADETASAPARAFLARPSGRLRFLNPGRTWSNALMWKDYHFLTGGRTAFLAKIIFYGVAVVAIAAWIRWDSGFLHWTAISESISATMLGLLVIELSIYSSRIFHDEIKWKTFSAISLLPVSTARLACSKAAGCLLAVVPAVLFLLAGAACDPWGFLEIAFSPGTWFGLASFAIFCHLTAALSLYVKWGALPLALAIMFVFSYCCPVFTIMFMLVMTGSEATWARPIILLVILFYAAVILVPLQLFIARRLRDIAAQ